LDNAGPAASTLTVIVSTPRTVRLTRVGGSDCRWSGSNGDYRCQPVRLAAGRSVTLLFDFAVSSADLPTGAADRRSVTVRPISGDDPDRSDNRSVYLIRGDDPGGTPATERTPR